MKETIFRARNTAGVNGLMLMATNMKGNGPTTI